MGGSSALVAVWVSFHLSKVIILQNAAGAALEQSRELKIQQERFNAKYCRIANSDSGSMLLLFEARDLCMRLASSSDLTSVEEPFLQFLSNVSIGEMSESYDSFSGFSGWPTVLAVLTEVGVPISNKEGFYNGGKPIPEDVTNLPPLPVDLNSVRDPTIEPIISRLYSMGFDQLIDDYQNIAIRREETFSVFQEIHNSAELILAKNYFIVIRILAVCAIALIFPVRVFKSIHEIKLHSK